MQIDFYHLQKTAKDTVLITLVEKSIAIGKRIFIKARTENINHIDELLWSYKDDSWVPHGAFGNGFEDKQPILIGDTVNHANQAEYLILTDGADISELDGFERCLNIFDEKSEKELQNARALWKALPTGNNKVNYWAQSSTGKWELKQSKA